MFSKWSRPPRHIVCPHDFKIFNAWELRFRDEKGKLHELAHKRLRRFTYPVYPTPRNLKLPDGSISLQKACPMCGNDLPYTAGQQRDIVIGLVGAKDSAKSHYIATLVDRLQNEVGRAFKATLMPVNDDTISTYKNMYYEPLYKHHIEIKVTDPNTNPKPLIYNLKIDGELWGKPKESRSVTMVFCDTAGENYDIGKDLSQTTPYLKVVAGLIFLIDPLQWEAVRQQVGPGVKLPRSYQDPSIILQRVTTEFEKRGLAPAQKIKTPVAVTLTKFDAVKDLIDAQSLWHTDVHHNGKYNMALHGAINKELARYLDKWGREGYRQLLKWYENHAFFAVSCTGCSSNEDGVFSKVTPWRVEDPLLWLLYHLGVIPGEVMSKL